jgi:hypothetical protein
MEEKKEYIRDNGALVARWTIVTIWHTAWHKQNVDKARFLYGPKESLESWSGNSQPTAGWILYMVSRILGPRFIQRPRSHPTFIVAYKILLAQLQDGNKQEPVELLD